MGCKKLSWTRGPPVSQNLRGKECANRTSKQQERSAGSLQAAPSAIVAILDSAQLWRPTVLEENKRASICADRLIDWSEHVGSYFRDQYWKDRGRDD
jgi:hypothetical protein